MYEDRTKVNERYFDRTLYNEAKQGAYYTDPAHCYSLSGLFKFPEGEKVTVLEPCIGNGVAVEQVTGAMQNLDYIRVLAVEKDAEVAEETAKKPFIEKLLVGDFLGDVVSSHNAASFCFCNPPYLVDETTGERMERSFLEKFTLYLKTGAVLVFVVPTHLLNDVSIQRFLIQNYEKIGVWRFRPQEYAKFKQAAYVCRKKAFKRAEPEEVEVAVRTFDTDKLSQIPVLPDSFEGTDLYRSVEVAPSDPALVKTFQTKRFDSGAVYKYISETADLSDFNKLVGKFCTEKKYLAADIGIAPMPLKNDLLYLSTTAGVGQGFAGEKGKDLHLQRGCAEIVEDKDYVPDEKDPDKGVVKVTSRTQVTMRLIETDGRITILV